MYQEYKVVNPDTGSEWFFFAHSFKTAYGHAKDFIARNKNNVNYKLFRINESVGSRWLPVRY